MNDDDVVVKPLLTEKTNSARTVNDQYYFKVHPKVNKVMVKKALENLFKVKIRKCNILNVKGKKNRSRYRTTYGSNWKKAIVTLKQGEKFSFYEGM